MLKRSVLSALTLGAIALAQPAFASFHLMQIEQIIGGVNGDTTRQAIQLRMRFASQNFVQQGQLVAWDAAGANPVVLLNIGAGVTNGGAGDRVLIATSNFLTGVRDFAMTSPIPASYLAAGKITFQSDGDPNTALVWWSVAWGGAGYTGSNNGVNTTNGGNDADGNFSPVFANALPSSSTSALRFTGATGDLSTNNAAQYQVTAGAATFTNNAGASQTVPVELMEFKVQ